MIDKLVDKEFLNRVFWELVEVKYEIIILRKKLEFSKCFFL